MKKKIFTTIFISLSLFGITFGNVCDQIQTPEWPDQTNKESTYEACMSGIEAYDSARDVYMNKASDLIDAEMKYVSCIESSTKDSECKDKKNSLQEAQNKEEEASSLVDTANSTMQTIFQGVETLKCQLTIAGELSTKKSSKKQVSENELPTLKGDAKEKEENRRKICRNVGSNSPECTNAKNTEEEAENLYDTKKDEYRTLKSDIRSLESELERVSTEGCPNTTLEGTENNTSPDGAPTSMNVGITCTKEDLVLGQCKMDAYRVLGIRQSSETSVGTFAQDLILSATMFIGTVVTLALIVSGLMFIFAGADTSLKEKAQKGLTNSLIGLLIVLSSYSVIRLVQFILKGD